MKDFSKTAYATSMKTKTSLPDFHQLCTPEQKYTKNLPALELFFFFLGSIAGFLWEVLLFYLLRGNYVNRGFFYGPWLPIYGSGAVLFHLLLTRTAPLTGCTPLPNAAVTFSMRTDKHRRGFTRLCRFLCLFFSSALLGSLIELSVGFFLNHLWGLRYWDYSAYPLQFHGYICLWSALGFGLAGTLFLGFLAPLLSRFFFRLSAKTRRLLLTLLLLLFVCDCVAAFLRPNTGSDITFP